MSKENYLKELFIDEAKPALNRHSGGGSSSGDLVDCSELPTENIDASKIYRVRQAEKKIVYGELKLYALVDGEITDMTDQTSFVDSTEDVNPDSSLSEMIVSRADGIMYTVDSDGNLVRYEIATGEDVVQLGFIDSLDEFDSVSAEKIAVGVLRLSEDRTVNVNYVAVPSDPGSETKYYIPSSDGGWYRPGLIKLLLESYGADRPTCFNSNPTIESLDNIIGYHDTSDVTDMDHMFYHCFKLRTVPLFDTRKVTNMAMMFYNCSRLLFVPSFDIRNVDSTSSMLYGCRTLTECWLRNIKAALTVGSYGEGYGQLLIVESLVHLIYELRDTGTPKSLTVGSKNLEKLANVYVKLVDITDEMRAEDDLIDEKLPFVVCESTDEGACLITEYATYKNWEIL